MSASDIVSGVERYDNSNGGAKVRLYPKQQDC